MRRGWFVPAVSVLAVLAACTSSPREGAQTPERPRAVAVYLALETDPDSGAQLEQVRTVWTAGTHRRTVSSGESGSGLSCPREGVLLWGDGPDIISSIPPQLVNSMLPSAGEGRVGDPVWSPDGSRVAYTVVHGLRAELRVGVQTLLTRQNGGWAAVRWSPDGSMLALASGTPPDADGYSTGVVEILRVKDRRVVRRYAWRGVDVGVGGWSADGRRLMVLGWPDGELLARRRLGIPLDMYLPGPATFLAPDGRLMFVGVAGRTVRTLRGAPYRNVGWAVLSPDGRRLAFGSRPPGQDDSSLSRFALHLARADGSRARAVRGAYAQGADGAVWSPDSTHLLLWRHRRGGRGFLWLLDADGSPVRRLADAGDGNSIGSAVWCPASGRASR